ncbi:MAG: tetratricopeptide repeat protein [Proteobacteria bacterium]|nr:tetratricopeptide repeat protein [Pseudomonadota bacterium]
MLALYEVFETALIDIKAGRLARAAGAFSQILALWPEHADSWFYLGEVREAEGDRTLAVACYRKAVETPGGHRAAEAALARIGVTLRRRALELERQGMGAEAAACWGELLLLDGAAEDAQARLRTSARVRVGEAEASQPTPEHLGSTTIWSVRDGLARIQSFQASGELPEAAMECCRILALNPALPALLDRLRALLVDCVDRAVTAWLRNDQVVEAAELLLTARRWQANDPKLLARQHEVVARLLEDGLKRQAARDANGARIAFSLATALDPAAEAPRRSMAALEEDAFRLGEAILGAAAALEAEGRLAEATQRYAEAAAESLEPRPIYARLQDVRFAPLQRASGRLLMPGIGTVEYTNTDGCTRLRLAAGAPKGTVLVAFHREPVLFDDGWEHFQVTSINWESREICRLFLQMGYAVDVVGFAAAPPGFGVDYAAVFTLAGFLARHNDALPKAARRIVLMTGSSPVFQNHAEQARIANLSRRRPGSYAAKRQVSDPQDHLHSLELADCGILIGNAVTLATYREALRARLQLIRVTASRVCCIKEPAEYAPSSREFLWYFGHGAVLKGLDLLLEIFSRQDRWTLNVVGHVAYEPDFDQLFFDELYRNPRIRMLGHLRGDSPALADACRRSFCFIAPSASEGMSNAVATCLQIGLYPILSRSTGIDLPSGCGIYLDSLSEGSIAAAVARAYAMEDGELRRQIAIIQQHALEAYSRPSYTRAMGGILERAMATAPAVAAGGR